MQKKRGRKTGERKRGGKGERGWEGEKGRVRRKGKGEGGRGWEDKIRKRGKEKMTQKEKKLEQSCVNI